MSHSSINLLGAVSIFLVKNVYAFTCNINGKTVTCPAFQDKSWCCTDHCCSFDEYTKDSSKIPTGFVIAFVVICIIILTCACCRYFAVRRRAQEIGLNAEQVTVVPYAPPPQVHVPPVTNVYNSPSPYDPPPPYDVVTPSAQPPLNPLYRSVERRFSHSKS